MEIKEGAVEVELIVMEQLDSSGADGKVADLEKSMHKKSNRKRVDNLHPKIVGN